MSPNQILETMVATTRRSTTAALTTVGPDGPRSRLMHPLWADNAIDGYLLTDGQSPKARDFRRSRRLSLTYFHADLWLLLTADASIDNNDERVSAAIDDCSTRDDGYQPSAFWNDDESARLIVVDLSLVSVDMARFNGHELEVATWRETTPKPSLS